MNSILREEQNQTIQRLTALNLHLQDVGLPDTFCVIEMHPPAHASVPVVDPVGNPHESVGVGRSYVLFYTWAGLVVFVMVGVIRYSWFRTVTFW
ncbi:MAG: hypothetical protein IPG73_07330 [Ignavibacteria bacterium]|nr:hypothetical protein [Ignavibacteria bacterium]